MTDRKLLNLLIDLEHHALRELLKHGYIARCEGCFVGKNPWFKITVGFPEDGDVEKVTCDDCEYAEESLVYGSLWCKKFRYEVSEGTPACSEFKRRSELKNE